MSNYEINAWDSEDALNEELTDEQLAEVQGAGDFNFGGILADYTTQVAVVSNNFVGGNIVVYQSH